MAPVDPEFVAAAHALDADGWCWIPQFLESAPTDALATECAALHDANLLLPAGTGATRTVSTARGDRTRWFNADALSGPQRTFADRIDALRVAFNRHLMLGLVDSESHYAVYRPGAVYARHLDRLRNDDSRVVSCVFYLNRDWHEADGGALRLHLPGGSFQDIYPHAGGLVAFLSGSFEHEVRPATRDRMSIACWMRQRPIDARR
ncbi:MAG TPA: 2OG-Fe(II) oxygenase [Rhodanobacter sp.]